MIEPWQIVESTWLLRSGFMDVRRDSCRTGDGSRARDYFAVDFKDFSVIVAITRHRELLLVSEYKHGARAVMRTLPAGFIEPGETPEQAARRELLEETGYAAASITGLGSFLLIPDLCTARGHVFIARDAEAVGVPHRDPDEELEVTTVSLDRVLPSLAGRGERYVDDASSLVALHMASPHLEAPGRGH